MDRQFSLLFMFMITTGVMARHVSQIIGGHDVRKREINFKPLSAKVISTVEDNDPDYPQQEVDQIFRELVRKNLTFFLTNDKDNKNFREEENRNYSNLCQFKTETFQPTIIEDVDGWRYNVLYSKGKLIQKVQYEICLPSLVSQVPDIFEKCKYVQSTKPGSSAYCTQQYIDVPLYTLHKSDHTKAELRYFKIESGCSCYIYKHQG